MDRRLRLRLRLLQLADQRSSDGPVATVSEEEIQRFRRHLRSLEDRLHAWDDVPAAALIQKVRALRPLVDNLERAVEHPETAAAGLAGLRRPLRVEWPPAPGAPGPGLKAAVNDNCADAIPIGDGTYSGDTSDATPDGDGCYSGSPDVWFAYSSPVTAEVVADTFGSGFDTVLSVYTGCPGSGVNEIACNDDSFGTQSAVSFQAQAGIRYLIRVAGCCGDGGATGPFTLNVGPGGVIAGTVNDAVTGEPVASAPLEAWTGDGYFAGFTFTDVEGDYQISGLADETYFVSIGGFDGYLAEVYDDLPCSFLQGCDPWAGTPIAVVSGATTGGIDFALQRGGTISGTVTKAATGGMLSDLAVNIWDGQGNELGHAYTTVAGHYSFSGLYPGTYYATTQSGFYRDELYDDRPCPGGGFGGCDPTTGEPIEVSFGATAEGIDFALERLGRITGEVTESSGGPALSVFVDAWDQDGQWVGSGFVFGTGLYEVSGLDAGNYFLTTDSFVHFDELYDDLPCEPDCDPTAGTPVAVSLNSTTSGIDFALERLGVITGTVSHRPTGEPIADASINVWDNLGNPAGFVVSSPTGAYVVEGLPSGNYTATVQDLYHRGELYDDIPCEGCDPTAGTPIAVNLNAMTGGIDFALERRAAISGRVTHSLTSQPLNFVTVDVYEASGALIGSAETDTSGEYMVRGLEPGNHFAVATGSQYFDQLYDGMPCEGGCDPTAGTPIATSLNTVTGGVDFTLDQLGSISGRVLHAGQPVTDAHIAIYDSSGSFRRDAFTDSAGDYTADSLPAGNNFAIAEHFQLDDELYDGLPCEGGCDPTAGTPIAVSLNTTTAGIDFDLGYCTPTDTSLCLTGDRFRVEAAWEDFQHVTGPGQAEGLTADAGYFWFFNPGNIELVVKVLDVCIEPHNRFWVFGAGLTDVGVELTVTDELTGDVRSYANPLGTPYQPVLDTLAFATCDAGLTEAAGGPVAGSPSSLWQPPLKVGSECLPGATSLCLNGGRFLAELVWQAPNGDGGAARAVPLTDESGYFWFGSADNVEVVVKVLDACDLAPFNNFWVFAAGLTNFEVTLRVTDTESGEFREYSNPQGTTFQAITDTGAFDTCPAPGTQTFGLIEAEPTNVTG